MLAMNALRPEKVKKAAATFSYNNPSTMQHFRTLIVEIIDLLIFIVVLNIDARWTPECKT